MTHDELLAKINAYHKTCSSGGSDRDVPKSFGWQCYNLHAMARALSAVVELHKPIKDQWIDYVTCTGCRVDGDDYYSPEYPCPTIQAIEKELV